ncbi:MAG: hypothetical protein IPH05_06120 [Flavobacteriales bacterium]|jgi:alginate O-acetyltransferase complex protein AlgJ|nr:hypothetical protein [Flavobacteriales bacterium]MBK6550953.1 hypothetical protein [Flavobacteriales bacterium]MBK6882510.1 hypothetical protein [Flavobacteriales bacterium]MBK7101275.1 hypothetical protein [Flavobacteriales bacterium]MBK7111982.1 hypothetical protein [Flavobacteriales bacterium]
MKLIKRILPFLIGLAVFGWTWEHTKAPPEPREDVRITLSIRSDVTDDIELFFDTSGTGFHTEASLRRKLLSSIALQELSFSLPRMDSLHGLRIDPGDHPILLELQSLRIDGPYRSTTWDAQDIIERFVVTNQMDTLAFDPITKSALLPCKGNDPFMTTGASLPMGTREVLSPARPVMLAFVKAALAGILAALLTALLLSMRWRVPDLRKIIAGRSLPVSLFVLLCAGSIFFAVCSFVSGIRIIDKDKEIHVFGTWHKADEVQVYYAERPDTFDKYHYAGRSVVPNRSPQLVRFTFASSTNLRHLRFDPGMSQDSIWLDSLRLTSGNASITWLPEAMKDRFATNEYVADVQIVDDRLLIITKGNDPFFRITEDVGPLFIELNGKSGNGPAPFIIAGIAALFFLFGSGQALARWLRSPDAHHSDMIIAWVFAVVVAAPLITMFTDTEPVLENTEKRTLAERPEFELHRALDFPIEYTTYFAENFGLRKVLFRWNSLFKALVLRTSPLPERTLFGKDGWMFYVQPGAMEKYQDICDINDQDLERVATRLELRRQWLAGQGIHYVLFVPPEKSAVYNDKLPDRIHRFGTPSCLDKLLVLLKERTQLQVVDIRDTLRSARAKHDVYYTTDTHWNPIGAWYGYKELIGALNAVDTAITPPKPFTAFTFQPKENDEGDLAVMIGLNDIFTRVSPMMAPKDSLLARDVAVGSFAKSGFFKYTPIAKEIPGSTKPRLLMFRDSFAVYMIPYLSEHFSHSTYVWTPIFLPDVVIEERPDVVVHEVMELYLSDLLEDDLDLPPTQLP